MMWFLLAAEVALLMAGLLQGRLHAMAPAAWVLLNLLPFWIYWQDKHAATQRAWRTSEQTLHMLSLLGGWPAAWWAQQLLRHKSIKPPFRQTYWLGVVLHLAALAGFALLPLALAGH